MRIVSLPELPVDDAYDPTQDRAITREELECLRTWMREDRPAFDEAPELPAHLYDAEVMAPRPRELSDDRTDALSGWAADAQW